MKIRMFFAMESADFCGDEIRSGVVVGALANPTENDLLDWSDRDPDSDYCVDGYELDDLRSLCASLEVESCFETHHGLCFRGRELAAWEQDFSDYPVRLTLEVVANESQKVFLRSALLGERDIHVAA